MDNEHSRILTSRQLKDELRVTIAQAKRVIEDSRRLIEESTYSWRKRSAFLNELLRFYRLALPPHWDELRVSYYVHAENDRAVEIREYSYL
jgi:hypothetical protein